MSATVVHIAGLDLIVQGHRQRQRCAWCGAVLVDNDLRNVAVQVEPGEEAKPPAVYPIGRLVQVDGDGGFRLFQVLPETDQLPEGSCTDLDDAVTE